MISKIIFKTMRGPFLILTPAVIMPAFSLALWQGADFQPLLFFLIFLGALFAHVSVNVLNEYCDYISGLDSITKQTPFSGGSKALPEKPDQVKNVFILFLVSLLITVLLGFYFLYQSGPGILPIGVLGVLIIVTYTTRLNQVPILCLLAPGLGFGPLMLLGAYYVIMKSFSLESFIVSLIPFFLVNNLLLLNQLPDIEADKKVGRYHFPIAYGYKKSIFVYLIFNLCVIATLFISVISEIMPSAILFAAIPALLSFIIYLQMKDNENFSDKQVHLLGLNVLIVISTPVIISIVLLISLLQ